MLIKKDYSEEFRLAKKICKELIADNKNAIVELYEHYQQIFINFARRRIYNNDVNHVESVLTNFWVELLNAKAICNYQAKASLKSYLMTILKRRIIDDNRKFGRQSSGEVPDDYPESAPPTPEDIIIREQQNKLLKEAVLMLADNSPKDADLIRMNLDGLNYRQMAEKTLNDQKTDHDEVKKRTNSIKKQFSRKRTGSMAKFKICLNRCLESHGLEYADILK